jgi:outer membrane protein TolC
MNNDILAFGDYEDSYTLSIGLSWSLWTPWTKANSYSQVRNSLMLKQWQYDENVSALNLDNQNLKREWNYLQETMALNRKKAAQANDNLLIAQERYNLGSLSMIELEQARINALEAELAVNKLTYQIQKKLQEWNLLNSQLILNKY